MYVSGMVTFDISLKVILMRFELIVFIESRELNVQLEKVIPSGKEAPSDISIV